MGVELPFPSVHIIIHTHTHTWSPTKMIPELRKLSYRETIVAMNLSMLEERRKTGDNYSFKVSE